MLKRISLLALIILAFLIVSCSPVLATDSTQVLYSSRPTATGISVLVTATPVTATSVPPTVTFIPLSDIDLKLDRNIEEYVCR